MRALFLFFNIKNFDNSIIFTNFALLKLKNKI